MRIIGIDPGIAVTGYALVERAGRAVRLVTAGAIETDPGRRHAQRLADLRAGLATAIAEHRPDAAAVERFFYKSRAALAIGQASGVVLATAAESGLDVCDYTPAEVKQAVVGHGNATKKQVQAMVAALLGLPGPPRPADVADACALAICHLNRAGLAHALERHRRVG